MYKTCYYDVYAYDIDILYTMYIILHSFTKSCVCRFNIILIFLLLFVIIFSPPLPHPHQKKCQSFVIYFTRTKESSITNNYIKVHINCIDIFYIHDLSQGL